MSQVLFEKRKNVGWITLNNPKKRNVLSLDLMNELDKILNNISKDRSIHVVVINAKGPSFCVGHDIEELAGVKHDLEHFHKIFSTCTDLMKKIQSLPQPVIAQVHGIATAAGCQLVAACDLAICDKKTKFCTPGTKIGLFCLTPMVPLSRVIGRRRALDMLFTGRNISATEAENFGLVNRVVDADELLKETETWANEIAKFSLRTLESGKKAFYHQVNLDDNLAYNYAKEAISKDCLSEDAQEGMSAFLEKRKPIWKDK